MMPRTMHLRLRPNSPGYENLRAVLTKNHEDLAVKRPLSPGNIGSGFPTLEGLAHVAGSSTDKLVNHRVISGACEAFHQMQLQTS